MNNIEDYKNLSGLDSSPDENQNFEMFYLDEYLDGVRTKNSEPQGVLSFTPDNESRFSILCDGVKQYFMKEWEKEQGRKSDHTDLLLERQKKAIIGYSVEVSYFKDKIREYLKDNNLLEEGFPSWYENLIDAVYHELWGLAGIAKWKTLKECSSAKIIGDRIYYLIDGKAELQEQRISSSRFEQLRHALLLKTPKKRLDEEYTEVYMHTGERIAIYRGDLTKADQPAMVFRKYIVDKYTFEEQAARNTIPKQAIPLFKSMVKLGFDVAFVGPVRSAKTTFLTTWQYYEDNTLEGLIVETDPEIPLHLIMPDAPIMQLIADGEELKNISKSILRSDADYLIMAEARDGYACNLSIEMSSKGTKRGKITYHLKRVEDFCYDFANKIISVFGGNLDYHMVKVSRSFDYIFYFKQLKNHAQKRLVGIYELRYEQDQKEVTYHQICKYDFNADTWSFKYDIGPDIKSYAEEEDREAFKVFDAELKKLSKEFPMYGDNVIYPIHSKVGAANG